MAQLRYSAMRSSGHTTTISPTSSTASNAAIDQVSMGRPEISTSCMPPSWPKRSPEPPAKIMAAVFGLFDTLPEKCTVLAPVSLKSRRAAASSATSTSAVGTNTGSITPNSAAPPTVLTFSGALMGSPFMASTTKGRPQTPLAWRRREGRAYGSLISRAVARHAATVAWRPGMRQIELRQQRFCFVCNAITFSRRGNHSCARRKS